MNRIRGLITLLVIVSANSGAQQKKRVAVMNFEYGTVRTDVVQLFGGDQDVGKGLADLLVAKLVQDGTYSVIERKELDKVVAEQNFSASDRADPAAAAKLGRVLSVDAIIVGTITQFGRDDKSTTLGGSVLGGAALGNFTSRFGIGGIQKRAAKAAVGITARVVDTSTGEILAAVEGEGESMRSGTSLVGAGGSSEGGAGGTYDVSSSNFGQTLLGEAANRAVASLASQLEQSAQQLPTRTLTVEGLVADVSDKSLTFNVGTKGGVKVGDQMDVLRKVRDIRDPATGKVIRSIENKIGSVSITEADELSAVGTFTGSPDPKMGDVVKGQAGSAQAAAQSQAQKLPAQRQLGEPGGSTSAQSSGAGTAAVSLKKPGVVRLGVVAPQARMGQAEGADLSVAEPIRSLIMQSLSHPAMEVTPIMAWAPAQIDAEAKQKECGYILYSSISQKKAGGTGLLNKAMPMANLIPMVAVAKSASSVLSTAMTAASGAQAAQAAASSAASSVKAKNEVTFEYKLMAPGSTAPVLANTAKLKARADGDDVILPLVQQAAAAIIAEVSKAK